MKCALSDATFPPAKSFNRRQWYKIISRSSINPSRSLDGTRPNYTIRRGFSSYDSSGFPHISPNILIFHYDNITNFGV